MRRFIGEVVSTRMQKTAVVLVERFRKNARLDKWVKYRKKFKVSKLSHFLCLFLEAKPERKKNPVKLISRAHTHTLSLTLSF